MSSENLSQFELDEHRIRLDSRWVDKYDFIKIGKKSTICLMTLENGFEIVGTSACVNPEMFDEKLGMKYAIYDAFDQLGDYNAFYEQEEGKMDDMNAFYQEEMRRKIL